MNKRLSFLVVWLAVFSVRTIAQGVSSPQPTTPEAQVQLGNDYLAGRDYEMAMTWFRKAADQDNAAAQNNVGWLYQNGWGVKQDYAEAVIWYRKAAEKGNAAAQVNIGWLYRKGYGVQKDYVEAMAWLRKAANQNNAQARANIGWLYEKGLGVKQDYAEAMAWFRKAADQGNTDAQNDIGELYQNGWGVKQDYSEALTWYFEAADKSNADAQNNLGWLYEKGLGVEQDYAQAMAWYYRAADHGLAQAQTNLGVFYRNGLGDKQDYVKALNWFRKAADQGDAKAQMNIGWLYEHGLGVQQDCVEAAMWYRKAVDQGYAAAQTNLGFLYQNGCGVKRDYAEAMSWYRKAAEQNDAMAQNNIAWFYQNGLGVKQDYSEAMNWYRKAAEQGNALAQANLKTLDKDLQENLTHGATQNSRSEAAASDKESAPRAIMAGGIIAPHAVYAPDPEYSEGARKAKLEGEVLLSLIVDPEGKARDIRVIAPFGDGLDEKAVDAIKTWKFDPATKDGKPVAVQIMIEVSFRLYGPSGMGKVEVVGDSYGMTFDSYLEPIILEAQKCWSEATEDKAHAPAIKQGQVTIQFAIRSDGVVGATEIDSSSGDDVLDHDARKCVSPLKTDKALPSGFKDKDVVARMQLLFNVRGMSINPTHTQIAAGGRTQFYLELAGNLTKAADWIVTGSGCTGTTCGTISPNGLYTAPDVLPDPPFVRVKGTLAGANPIAVSAIVTLIKKR